MENEDYPNPDLQRDMTDLQRDMEEIIKIIKQGGIVRMPANKNIKKDEIVYIPSDKNIKKNEDTNFIMVKNPRSFDVDKDERRYMIQKDMP